MTDTRAVSPDMGGAATSSRPPMERDADTTLDTPVRSALRHLVVGDDLDKAQAAAIMRALVNGDFTPAQFGALAVALRMKGERGHEISGFVEVLRESGQRVDLGDLKHRAVDMCGTGGDGPSAHVFNVSTTSAFLVAGAGVPVAKHGTSAVSSDSGSSDLLCALGVRAVMTPAEAERCLREVGMTYMHAPAFNSGMRHLIGLRREIGLRFVFNLLGPLCNPASVDRQIIGLYDRRYLPVVADALVQCGTRRAWIVNARDGLDEVSTTAVTDVVEVVDGRCLESEVNPGELGLAPASLEELRGGDPHHNAEITRSVLNGRGTRAQTEIVLLTAAATMVVADHASDLSAGLAAAEESLRSGAAQNVLDRWVDWSSRLERGAVRC